jgi:UDP-glucose 4-epimerase
LKRILITGASGLVGSHLLPMFGPDEEVHVVARAPLVESDIAPANVHLLDLGRPFEDSDLPDRIDSVVYLAQSENFRAFPEQVRDVFDVNLSSLLHMLDYARRAGASSFVSASSGGVYGSSAGPIGEDFPIEPTGKLGFYLSSKLCGEILAETYAPFMNIAVLRLFFAYGKGQRRSMLIPRLIDNIRAGNPVTLQGEDGITLNPVHALDAAAACKAALGLEGFNPVNVAGPDIVSMRELCELIGERVGRAPVFDVRPGNPNENLIAVTERMEALLATPLRRLHDHIEELL